MFRKYASQFSCHKGNQETVYYNISVEFHLIGEVYILKRSLTLYWFVLGMAIDCRFAKGLIALRSDRLHVTCDVFICILKAFKQSL